MDGADTLLERLLAAEGARCLRWVVVHGEDVQAIVVR